MENQDLRIRAKKISELERFELSNFSNDKDHSYIIIGFNDGVNKQNYKMSLTTFFSLNPGSEIELDDETLKNKIQYFINNHDIALPTIQGPRGPQGEKGDSADPNELLNIQNQITELQNLINMYHGVYTISYVLSNVVALPSNASMIGYNSNTTLYFQANTGYVMPDNITVENCEYYYNKLNKSVKISNPTGNVRIIINGVQGSYTLTKNFINVTYEPIGTELNSYGIGGSVSYKIHAAENYRLPESITSYSNCSVSYTLISEDEARLTVTCTGTGNMIVNIEGVNNIVYYFGIISICEENNDKITVEWLKTGDNTIAGIDTANVKLLNWMNSSFQCPFTLGEIITIPDTVYSNTDTVMIVPEIFYNPTTAKFNNGVTTGQLHTPTSPFPMQFEIYGTTYINAVKYYIIYCETGFKAGEELIID